MELPKVPADRKLARETEACRRQGGLDSGMAGLRILAGCSRGQSGRDGALVARGKQRLGAKSGLEAATKAHCTGTALQPRSTDFSMSGLLTGGSTGVSAYLSLASTRPPMPSTINASLGKLLPYARSDGNCAADGG